MKILSDDSRVFFLPIFITVVCGKYRGNILELSETIFMDLQPYVFDVDHVAKIRSELSITVLEKKMNKITTKKVYIRTR